MFLAKRSEHMHCKTCTFWNNKDNLGMCTNQNSPSYGRRSIPAWAGCVCWSQEQERKSKAS